VAWPDVKMGDMPQASRRRNRSPCPYRRVLTGHRREAATREALRLWGHGLSVFEGARKMGLPGNQVMGLLWNCITERYAAWGG
jgi:hypothetical protein